MTQSDAENLHDAWLGRLVDDIGGCMEAVSPMGPLGYCWNEEDGFWEIGIYPTPVELLGGAVDGEIVTPDFSIDMEELRKLFD